MGRRLGDGTRDPDAARPVAPGRPGQVVQLGSLDGIHRLAPGAVESEILMFPCPQGMGQAGTSLRTGNPRKNIPIQSTPCPAPECSGGATHGAGTMTTLPRRAPRRSARGRHMTRRFLSVVACIVAVAACGGKSTSPVSPSPTPTGTPATGCARTSIGQTPLNDLAGGSYKANVVASTPGCQRAGGPARGRGVVARPGHRASGRRGRRRRSDRLPADIEGDGGEVGSSRR